MSIGSLGIKVRHSKDGGASWTNIEKPISASIPPPEQETWEDKHLSQDGPGIKKQGTGFVNGGQFTLGYAYEKGAFAYLNTLVGSKYPTDWELTFPLDEGETTPSKVTFKGILVSGPGAEFSDDGSRVEGEITVEVSDLLNFTPGT